MPDTSARQPAESLVAANPSYDEFVSSSPQGSPFATSWWLDATAGAGKWRTNALEQDGRIVAAWPTVVRRSRFGDVHVGAPLTPCLGPLLPPGGDAGPVRRRAAEIEQLEALADSLVPYAHLEARCHPAFDYWTPLHWRGFTQTTFYTWRLNDLTDLEATFAGMRENVRRQVRKARKVGLSVEEGTLDDFLPLHRQTFDRQGLAAAAPQEALLRRIDAAAAARDARTILVARDGEGRAHSASMFVHDSRCTWYLLGGSDTQLRSSGSASLVMWSGIERAAASGHVFDFEGSMLQHVERFVRAFGGEPVPYSILHSTPSRAFDLQRSAKRRARQARAALREARRT